MNSPTAWQLKSLTSGFASFEYEPDGFEESSIEKLDIYLKFKPVDALSTIVHSSKVRSVGRDLCMRLKEAIPRQLFEIPIQAKVGATVVARETLKALRKDVLAKCYGGDITRKRKLLERQKEGKRLMREIGEVRVTPNTFRAVLGTHQKEDSDSD